MQSAKHCRICGRLITSHAQAKCCSNECKAIYYKSLLNPELTKHCEICNKEYTTQKPKQRFCSAQCKRDAARIYSNNYNRIHKNAKLQLRFSILARDGFKCRYCGRSASEDNVKLHVDHILNKANGGDDDPSNLITACEDCNIGKGKQLLVTNAGQIPTYLTITTLKPKQVP